MSPTWSPPRWTFSIDIWLRSIVATRPPWHRRSTFRITGLPAGACRSGRMPKTICGTFTRGLAMHGTTPLGISVIRLAAVGTGRTLMCSSAATAPTDRCWAVIAPYGSLLASTDAGPRSCGRALRLRPWRLCRRWRLSPSAALLCASLPGSWPPYRTHRNRDQQKSQRERRNGDQRQWREIGPVNGAVGRERDGRKHDPERSQRRDTPAASPCPCEKELQHQIDRHGGNDRLPE